MNFEIIIRKCQEAIKIEDSINWYNDFYKNNPDLPNEQIQHILDVIKNYEKKLMNCKTTIKSLTI